MNISLLFLIGISINSKLFYPTYVVTYKNEIYKVASNINPPKIVVPEEYKAVLGKDSIDILETILPYTVMVEIRTTTKGEYSYREWSENPRLPLADKGAKFYKNGKFYSSQDSSPIKPINYKFKKVKGSKVILGYTCVKFIGTNQDTKETYEVWATQALPQSITALHLLRPFGYAILEIKHLQGFWKRTATSVMKSDEKEDVVKSNFFKFHIIE